MAENDLGICLLPLSRIKTIMRSSPDVSTISQEALFMTGKATEMFIQLLAQSSLVDSADLPYKDVSDIVDSEEKFQFLQDIIPKKIKAREFLKLLETVAAGDS